MLKKLASKTRLTILGLNSGTSADGIDLALIECPRKGRNLQSRFIEGRMVPYPARVRRELGRILDDTSVSTEKLARLNVAYGRYLGKVARAYISDRKLRVDLIGAHGQTVRHYPKKVNYLGEKISATIQTGDGATLAAVTGIPVVSDFRLTDIALGGEGAPLTPFVNQLMFGDRKASRIIVNIGGIANFSYHPAGGDLAAVAGGDCGPGNRLSDLACEILYNKKYDKDGEIARGGRILGSVVKKIIATSRPSTVSIGRDRYDELLLARLIFLTRREKASYEDLMASIVDASARLIYRSVRKYLKDSKLAGIYLTGGGRRNLFLVKRIQECIDPIGLWPVEKLGYHGDLLEAISFAVLAGCYVFGMPSTLPQITGASWGGIAGKLSLPRI